MNPFVWVLVDFEGNPESMLPDSEEMTLDRALDAFTLRAGLMRTERLAELGYRVLRCKLTEVGPA